MKRVEIYTDGSCFYGSGLGGIGVILRFGDTEKEISRGFSSTTTNRMELLAAIIGIESLKSPCIISLTSDSEYVVKGINERLSAYRWRGYLRSSRMVIVLANGSKETIATRNMAPAMIPNHDLWRRLSDALERHTINAIWVRGHTGHPENERCDALATTAFRNGPYTEDRISKPCTTP